MASQPKAPITTFNTDWAKVRGWAKNQGISDTAVNNVFALDSARMTSGYYEMSNAERTRAVLAAAGINQAPTQLPSDNPSPTDVFGNTVRDVQNIATGLMPTRLVSNIWDTLKTTAHDLEHPQGTSLGKALTTTVLSWIPGAYDVGQVMEAHGLEKGLAQLAEHPVTSLIDVMPYLKALDVGAGAMAAEGGARVAATDAARTAAAGVVGKTLADRLGIGVAGKSPSAIRMFGQSVGKISFGKEGFARDALGNPIRDSEGNFVIKPMSLANRYQKAAMHFQVGTPLRHAGESLFSITHEASRENWKLERDLIDKVKDFTPDQLAEWNRVMHSGRSAQDLLHDNSISLPLREAIKAYIPWEQWHQEYMIDSGMVLEMHLPDGSKALYEKTSPVWPAQKRADDALEEAHKASEKSDELLSQADQADAFWAPKQARLTELKDAVSGAVTSAQGAALHGTIRNVFGRLAGRDGLLEQMQQAFEQKDWVTFRKAAKDARRVMTQSKSVQAAWDRVPQLAELKALTEQAAEYGMSRAKLERDYKTAFEGTTAASKKTSAQAMNDKAEKELGKFMDAVRRNPPAAYRDVVANRFVKNFLDSDEREIRLDEAAAKLKEKGADPEIVDRIRSNPQRMFELVTALFDPTFRDPFIPDMISAGERKRFMDDALKEADLMRARGETPMYVPSLGPKDALGAYLHGTDVFVNPTKFRPTVNSSFAKSLDASNTVHDVMLGVSKATKDLLTRDATVHFFHEIIVPMLQGQTELERSIVRDRKGLQTIEQQISGTPQAVMDSLIAEEYGLAEVNIKDLIGLSPEELGLHPDERYFLPKDYLKGLDSLVNKYQFPLKGAWDKATGVFKFSILGLSPRYTAHVMFGGGLMLALRSSPAALKFIPTAARAVWAYHHGNDVEDTVPSEIFRGATQVGSPDRQFHWMGGRQMGGLTVQEKLASWGIDWKVAKGVDIARAAADVNFRFTNYVADMQQAIAYLDGSWKATRQGKFRDPVTGEIKRMTPDRARLEGIRHAEAVMGNLSTMAPLERAVARKVMPFYGWTKHVLKYVLTYPFDHPLRASFLITLATQNSERFAQGLDTRMQLMMFLGQPDAAGDVSAIDVRALDPFRDVANYATLGGWLSSMNPLLVAPAATIDPQIIFGSNVLHPNISYSQMYGTNIAGPGGNLMTALEQEIPETQVLDDALGLTDQARSLRRAGGPAYGKAIFEALGIPFAQVQHLNLQQIAAKHELDRYNQAKADALNAWQTGDFSTLDKYPGTVPDPLQADYDITPAALHAQYVAAQKKNPTLPPSETVPQLPAPAV